MPICAVIVWLIAVKGQYKSVEKIFLAASFFYITYIFAGLLAKPAWMEAIKATLKPPRSAPFMITYLYMVIGVVGTTIAPWMQFYLQSSIVEKGVTRRQYKASQLDVIVGCIFTDVVAWFIIVACAATLYVHGVRDIRDAADAAQSLRPLAGDWAYILFALGLFNASLFAASILPLSTAYTVCEGLGFESGVERKFSEAPAFYWLYTILIAAGAAVVIDPRPSADQDRRLLAGGEWRRSAVRADLHVAAHQQKRADGRIRQQAIVQHHRLGDNRNYDRSDGGVRIRTGLRRAGIEADGRTALSAFSKVLAIEKPSA